MKRSARIANAKGGGSSGAAATPGADDGDDRARAEKKDYIADNPVWRMNLAHSPTRAKTLMELGKDMYEPFGITDRKTQEYVNASAAWSKQRVGNTDLSRNAIARAKRLVQQDAEAAATNAKTYTIEIKTHSGDIERFPAVIGPGRDGWYRLAVHAEAGAEEQNAEGQNTTDGDEAAVAAAAAAAAAAAGDIDGSNDASATASEEEGESEVLRLRRELEAVQSQMQVQQTIIEEHGLGGVLHDRLEDQEQQEQQGRTRDDDGDGDEEEEEEAPHIHFDDEANDVIDGGIGIGQEPKQKEPKQQQQQLQGKQQQQPKLKERGLKKADANVVGNGADVEVEQGHEDDDRAKTRGGDGGGGRGDYVNRECTRAGGGINHGGDGASSAAMKRQQQQQVQGRQQPGHDNGDSADVGVQAGAAGAELVTQEQLDELRDEVFAKLDGKMNKDALKIIFAALNDRPSREDVFAALNTRATREELNQVEALLRRELDGKAEETEVSTALSYLGKQQVEQRMETTQEYKSVYSTMETNKMEVLAEVNEIVKRALSNRRSEDKDKLEDENNNLEDNEESNDEEEGEEEESSDEGN